MFLTFGNFRKFPEIFKKTRVNNYQTTAWSIAPTPDKGPDGAESGEFLGTVLDQSVRNRDLKNIE